MYISCSHPKLISDTYMNFVGIRAYLTTNRPIANFSFQTWTKSYWDSHPRAQYWSGYCDEHHFVSCSILIPISRSHTNDGCAQIRAECELQSRSLALHIRGLRLSETHNRTFSRPNTRQHSGTLPWPLAGFEPTKQCFSGTYSMLMVQHGDPDLPWQNPTLHSIIII
jgi:hypothetical protein